LPNAWCMVHVELHFQMPPAWKKANAKNNIHVSSNPKRWWMYTDILFIGTEIRGTHFWFMALNWTIVGWYCTMSIYQPSTMRTSTLRSVTTFVQSSIYSNTYMTHSQLLKGLKCEPK
jgi:hypothetical protein